MSLPVKSRKVVDLSSDDESDDGFGGMFSKLASATLEIEEEEEIEEAATATLAGVTYETLLNEYLISEEDVLRNVMAKSNSPGLRHVAALLLNLLRGQ